MKPKKKIVPLFLIPIAMFGFGYLMVPIYDVFCDLTGLNGKTGSVEVAEVERMEVDLTRMVKVEFMANVNQDTPLDFEPTQRSMWVHPGKTYQAMYRTANQKSEPTVGQAVPSVSPFKAASYFDKVECFCFTQQAFKAHESRELPVIFVVDPKLPKEIETVTLSYTFFEVGKHVHKKKKKDDAGHAHSSKDVL